MSSTIMDLHFPSPPRAMQDPRSMTTKGGITKGNESAWPAPLATCPSPLIAVATTTDDAQPQAESPEPLSSSPPPSKAAALVSSSAATSRPVARFTSYHRPIRAGTPSSLDLRPGSTPPEQTPSLLLEPTDENAEMGIIAIGMALGSPSHPPPQNTTMTTAWRPQFEPTVMTTVEAMSPYKEEALRANKPRKWGFFARSRSKRGKDAPARPQDQETTNAASSAPSGLFRSISGAGRSRKARERKELADKARRNSLVSSPRVDTSVNQTREAGTNQRQMQILELPIRSNMDKSAQPRTHTRHLLQKPTKFHGGNGQPIVAPPLPPEPLLDIEIPDVTMERYSVMFSHLLDNRSTTSLLARRQATWDKLKALREDEVYTRQPGPARASPRPAAAPRMLKIARERTQDQPQALRRRSNTFPSLLPSPSRSNFEFVDGSAEQAAWQQDQDRSAHADAPRHVSAAADRRRLISKFHQQPSPKAAKDKAKDSNAWAKPSSLNDEGNFQIGTVSPISHSKALTPPASSAVLSTPRTLAEHAAEPSPPSSPVKTLRSSIGSLLDEEAEVQHVSQAPVKVSVARQISVSRQQRPLLGALQRHALENKRLNETKTVVPRLVDPRQDPTSPQALHRKSERVVVEGS